MNTGNQYYDSNNMQGRGYAGGPQGVFLMISSSDAVFSFAGMSIAGSISKGRLRAGEEVEVYCVATGEAIPTRVSQIQKNGESLESAGRRDQSISILTDVMYAVFPHGSEILVYRKGDQARAIKLYEAIQSGLDIPDEDSDEQPYYGDTATGNYGQDGVSFSSPAPKKGGMQKILIPAIICAALCLGGVITAIAVLHTGNDEDPSMNQQDQSGQVEADADSSQGENEAEDESWREFVDDDIHILTWDLDFSNSTIKNPDGTCSFYNTMYVENDTDHAITGIAFLSKNKNGNLVANMDPDCSSTSDPFYAEGYIPAGERGVMVSRMRLSKKAYDFAKKNRPWPSNQNANPNDNSVEIIDAYPFKGGSGYCQATGYLEGPLKGKKPPEYNAVLSNSSSTPVHKDAMIVAYRLGQGNGHPTLNVSSAQGVVDREIDPGESDVTIGSALKDPGFEGYDYDTSEYDVCVIDNEYSDGSHYSDEYDSDYRY